MFFKVSRYSAYIFTLINALSWWSLYVGFPLFSLTCNALNPHSFCISLWASGWFFSPVPSDL